MPDADDLAARLWPLRPASGPYVVGVTGGVAAGKSTLSDALADAIRRMSRASRVERVSTDGFLRTNADLTAAGLLARKGFPESYDRAALARALSDIRRGAVSFPGYSHDLYDVDPALARTVEPPDVLVIEGLGLDADLPLDVLVYLDAEPADQEAWYVARFLGFWEHGRDDPRSFYFRFHDLDREAVGRLASSVWRQVNLPNLETHIRPIRALATLVVTKRADHAIASIAPPA